MISNDDASKSDQMEVEAVSSKTLATKKKIRKTKPLALKNKKNGAGGSGKKRGRKRGSKNKKKANALDSDTEKFIKSFKNSNLSLKKSRRIQENSAAKQPIGPVVQKIRQKIQINQRWIECSNYAVKNQTINLNDQDDLGKYKSIVPKEKSTSITVKSNGAATCVENICSFCHLKSNEISGIGELFGPYYKESELSDSHAEEIFVHAGCAIWTRDIFVLENKVFGLYQSVTESKEYTCSNCEKNGATLICKVLSCGKMFHYPCAIKNELKIKATFKCMRSYYCTLKLRRHLSWLQSVF